MAKKTISNTFVVTTLIDGEDSLSLELDTYAIAFPTDSDYSVPSQLTYTVGAKMFLGNDNNAQQTITNISASAPEGEEDIYLYPKSDNSGIRINIGEQFFRYVIPITVTATCAKGSRTATINLTPTPKGAKGDKGNDGINGTDGARGKIGRFFYFAGTFNSSNTSDSFLVNDAQAPYFEHMVDGQKRYHVFNYETNGSYTMAQMWAISSNWNNKPWEVMTDNFKYLITEAMFAEYAKLASAIFNGDWMLSQYGTNPINFTAEDKSMFEDIAEYGMYGTQNVIPQLANLWNNNTHQYKKTEPYWDDLADNVGLEEEQIERAIDIGYWANTNNVAWADLLSMSDHSYTLFGKDANNPFKMFAPNTAIDFLTGNAYFNKAFGNIMKPQIRITAGNINDYKRVTGTQANRKVYIVVPQREKSIQIEWVDNSAIEAYVLMPEIMSDEVGVELIITNATEYDYNRTSRDVGVTLKVRGGVKDPETSTDPDPNRWLINGIAKNTVASPTTMGRVVEIPIYHEAHFRSVQLPDGTNTAVGARAWVCTGIINLSNKTIS